MEDNQIVELYWKRDESAIKESEIKYGAYCYAVAYNILDNNEDSEECVNDTWNKAWHSIPPHRPGKLKMFLAKITRNRAFNMYRMHNVSRRGCGEINLVLDELDECISGGTDVEDEYIAKELGEFVEKFVRELSRRDANVFLRRYFFTEPVQVISERYGISESNVTVILSRTRRKLRKKLIKEGFIDEQE